MSNANSSSPHDTQPLPKGTAAGPKNPTAAKNKTTASKTVTHATRQAARTVVQTAGQGLSLLQQQPVLRTLTKPLRAGGVLDVLERVDIKSAEAAVAELRRQYPHESPSQLTNRLIAQKAFKAASIGLATNAVPGVSLVLTPLDWAMSALLQAELVYQIAGAYGLDMHDSARKSEVTAVFGLSLGSAKAVKFLAGRFPQAGAKIGAKLGLTAAKKVPFAGAVLGAGADALLLYGVGQAARRFYEARLHEPDDDAALRQQSAQNDATWDKAARQEALFHRIIAHLLHSVRPQHQWRDWEPQIAAQFDGPARQRIADEWHRPTLLTELLAQVDPVLRLSLWAECRRLAELWSDGPENAATAALLQAIKTGE